MVDDSLQVASVAAERLAAVGLLPGVGSVVVAGIGIRKPVGTDEVDEIRGRETRPLRGAFLARKYLIGTGKTHSVLREHQVVLPGLHSGPHCHIDEEVVGALGLVDLLDGRASCELDIPGSDVLPVDHELEGGLHACPPARGLDMGNPRLGGPDLPFPRCTHPHAHSHGVLLAEPLEHEHGIVLRDDFETGVPAVQGRM